MAGIRTKVPSQFGKGAAYYGTHMNRLMKELKPDTCVLQGGLVKQQSSADMTVIIPDLIYAINETIYQRVGGNSDALTVASGTAQVETATVVGTITKAGSISVVVNSLLIPGGVNAGVGVEIGDDATAVAGKIKTNLGSSITTHYTVGGTGATVTLTAKVKAANDETLNISIANGDAEGLTEAPTSANTTAGVAPKVRAAIIQVGADKTIDIKYGSEVNPDAPVPIPIPDSDHALICVISPISSDTATITNSLIDNTLRDMPR